MNSKNKNNFNDFLNKLAFIDFQQKFSINLEIKRYQI